MVGEQLLPTVSASIIHLRDLSITRMSYRIRGDVAQVLQKRRETTSDFQYTSQRAASKKDSSPFFVFWILLHLSGETCSIDSVVTDIEHQKDEEMKLSIIHR